jgi:hypothetical protein
MSAIGPEVDLALIVLNSKTRQTMHLHEQLETVTDEATFLAFVRALVADKRSDAERWANGSIEDFLEAGCSWAEDSRFGSQQGLSSASPWQKFATFFYCGKIYE